MCSMYLLNFHIFCEQVYGSIFVLLFTLYAYIYISSITFLIKLSKDISLVILLNVQTAIDVQDERYCSGSPAQRINACCV